MLQVSSHSTSVQYFVHSFKRETRNALTVVRFLNTLARKSCHGVHLSLSAASIGHPDLKLKPKTPREQLSFPAYTSIWGQSEATAVTKCRSTLFEDSPGYAEEHFVEDGTDLWMQVRMEARHLSLSEPYLASFLYASVLAHSSLERALAFHIANKLANSTLLSTQLFTLFADIFTAEDSIKIAIRADMRAFRERDPACTSYVEGMLNFKGFLACQSHRASKWLWDQGRQSLALALQSRVSEVFQVDIHPGASLGHGLLFDHATGLVVGETAVVGNHVSILHHVTLGGTGAACGNRHPKVHDGVLIGAGAILLGNISIGEGSQIGASSLVLQDVPAHCIAIGVPAQILPPSHKALTDANHHPGRLMNHCSAAVLEYEI